MPGEVDVEGIEISAGMLPTEEVGGDYYDVIPVKDGCWIGIGDVAGHGLGAGLIMLMIQSALQGLVSLAPDAAPRDLVSALNRVLFENVRRRMNRDEHTTLCLVRYSADGTLIFAGAHEDILICRATGGCEVVQTRGTWLGAVKDVGPVTPDTTLQLQPGDLMLLYSDGAIEASDARGEQFGIERLSALLEQHRESPAAVARNAILQALTAWCPRPADDVTLITIRCQGVYWES